MSKRLANILDASLPPPPELRYFLDAVQKWQNASVRPARKDPVHGNIFGRSTKSSGSMNCEKAGIASLLQFADVCLQQAATYDTLDAFFVAWGQWVLEPSQMFDTAAEQEQCMQQRVQQAGDRFKVYSVPIGTFRTYMNAAARAYMAQVAPIPNHKPAVPSSVKQFPEYARFLRAVITRARGAKAVANAANPQSDILRPEELPMVMATVNHHNVQQRQKANILLIGFQTGLRAEVLRRLVVGNLQPGQTEDGRKSYKFVVGTMKNLPANLQHLDAPFFNQV